MILDKLLVERKPPEDTTVKAKLKESKSLKSVTLYKKIMKTVLRE